MIRRVLLAKAHYTDTQVQEVWDRIWDYVTIDEAMDAVDQAAAEVRQVVGQHSAVYGWSGGKDSQALQVVMDRAGIHRAVCGIIPNLEWRAYLNWIDGHHPEGLEIIPNNDLDVRWLAQPGHGKYLFPRNSQDGYFWTTAGTRRAQHTYQDRHHPVFQIYGRRKADGNQCGRSPHGIHVSGKLTAYNPLRDWSHELTLAVVHYNRMPLPPVYRWPHGWTAGTGSWPGRRVGSIEESWAETFEIEPDRVREAAVHLPAAAAWLATRED